MPKSLACRKKSNEKFREKINNIVVDNYEKYLQMSLRCYRNFNITSSDACADTPAFRNWWIYHQSQTLGAVAIAKEFVVPEMVDEIVEVALFKEGFREEVIVEKQSSELVNFEDVVIVQEEGAVVEPEPVKVALTQQEKMRGWLDELLAPIGDECGEAEELCSWDVSLNEHLAMSRGPGSDFIVQPVDRSRPQVRSYTLSGRLGYDLRPVGKYRKVLKPKRCGVFCDMPGEELQCIVDSSAPVRRLVALYATVGSCEHLPSLPTPKTLPALFGSVQVRNRGLMNRFISELDHDVCFGKLGAFLKEADVRQLLHFQLCHDHAKSACVFNSGFSIPLDGHGPPRNSMMCRRVYDKRGNALKWPQASACRR